MKTRLKIYGSVAVVLLVAAGILKYGTAELSAATWHLQHGLHTDFGGIRIHAPMSYETSDPEGLSWLSISRFSGTLWHDRGVIFLDLRGLPSPEAIEAAETRLKEMGKNDELTRTRVAEHSVTFAGRRGKCVEYNTALALRAPLNGYGIKGYEIQCRFEGSVSLEFMGSPKLRDDFYNIIQTAEPLTAKN